MYYISFAGGAPDRYYDTYEEAVAAVLSEWPDAEIGHDGDIDDGGDQTLVWESEEESEGDGGQRAVASIHIRAYECG